jgi:hypothetical protein
MQPKGNMTPLTVENLAQDSNGVTVNAEGTVTEYKNTGINKPMKKMCEECGDMYEGKMCECGTGGDMYEGKLCECGSGMNESECSEFWSEMYSEEQIEESIKLKSKKSSVIKDINESLNWFKKLI